MNPNLEPDLILTIGEDLEAGSRSMSLNLLFAKIASLSQSEMDLTQSTIISLQTFERAEVFRTIRQLWTKRLLAFCDKDGKILKDDASGIETKLGEAGGPSFLTLTEDGQEHYQHLQYMQRRDEIDDASLDEDEEFEEEEDE